MPADPSFLHDYAATWRFQLGAPRSFGVAPDGTVLFLRSDPRSFEHALWEQTPDGAERRLLTAAELLGRSDTALSPAELARLERLRSAVRGIGTIAADSRLERLVIPLGGRLFLYSRTDARVTLLPAPAEGPTLDPRFSPDGLQIACVIAGDLWVYSLDGTWTRLTDTASETLTNGLPEFVAEEEMHRYVGYWWCPDSQHLAFEEVDHTGVERFFVADASAPERIPAANFYPRAGRQNVSVRLGVVPVTGGQVRWLGWDLVAFPYLAQVCWAARTVLLALVQDRGQQRQHLLRFTTGQPTPTVILVEEDPAWLNLYPSMPMVTHGPPGFLWISERDGAPCLEHRCPDGELLARLTPPELGLHLVSGVQGEEVVVVAGPDPGERALYAVPLRGGEARRLVGPPGVYQATVGSGGRVEIASTETGQTATWVRGDQRRLIKSVAQVPARLAELEYTTVSIPADDTGPARELRAMILRPREHTPGSRWPVLVYVYGGPHVQLVQRHAAAFHLQQWYADHGFVVVTMDARGTPGRGRAWERAIRGDVIRGPMADQIAGLHALAERYPEMDLNRVGIQGWSFGGYFSAMAVLRHPEVFHAAVVGAPVVDWADYDTHYTERYLGLPAENPDGYRNGNVLTWAAGLSRPLLLVHGTADDNVYFKHALRLSDALFRAGRSFEFLPLAGYTHMVPDPVVTFRLYERVIRFFMEKLR